MYVMGNYPKCYTIIDENKNPQLVCDPRVYKVNPRFFMSASKTKKAEDEDEEEVEEKTPEEMLDALIQKAEELEEIKNLDPEVVNQLLDEVRELKEILELEPEEQAERLDEIRESDELENRRKEENKDSTPEEDTNELKKRRRQEADFKRQYDDPEDAKFKSETSSRATIEPKYSALEYRVSSLGFEKIGENGDQLMKRIGCY